MTIAIVEYLQHGEPHYLWEVEFLSALEVRALADILIAHRFETGSMHLFPTYAAYHEPNPALDLFDKATLRG